MIKVTTWTPDTCGCVTRYSWDTETSEDERIHTHESHPRICPDHRGLRGVELHDVLVVENSRKNLALGQILDRLPRLRAMTEDVATALMVQGADWELLAPHLSKVNLAHPHVPGDPAKAWARMFALHMEHAATLGPQLLLDHEYRWSYEGRGANRTLAAAIVDKVTGRSVLDPAFTAELATFHPPMLQLSGKLVEVS